MIRRHSTDAKIQRSLAESAQSWNLFQSTLQIFLSNVQRRQLGKAEDERAALHEHLDNYLDQYMLAGRLALEDPNP